MQHARGAENYSSGYTKRHVSSSQPIYRMCSETAKLCVANFRVRVLFAAAPMCSESWGGDCEAGQVDVGGWQVCFAGWGRKEWLRSRPDCYKYKSACVSRARKRTSDLSLL